MPKIHVKKGSVSLDMTAMCDVAFLLLTFFILTAKAKPVEPVEVMTPSSIVDLPVPDVNIITILIDKPGRVFIGMDNFQKSREVWLENLASQFKLTLTDDQKKDFINGGVIPVAAENLVQYLGADANAKKEIIAQSKGIPVDSSNTEANQLKDWIINARRANQNASIVIKSDAKAPYSVVKRVMKTLQKQGIFKFSLLTSLGGKD